jgi:4-amino-4-deoxy-L-arabinose transferase-like glycosyltransferase
MDVMMTQEGLNNLWMVLFVVTLLELGAAAPSRRMLWGIAAGAMSGLALLTKISNLILPAVLACGALLELVQRRDLALRQRVARLPAWLAALALGLALASPQYIHNRIEHGRALLDGWHKRETAATIQAAAHRRDVLDRRTLGFVVGLTADVVRFPYHPLGTDPTARFWPTLIASTFCDYYNYSFNQPRDRAGSVFANGRAVGLGRTLQVAQASVSAGFGVALLAVVGWLVALVRLLRAREVVRPTVMLLPLLCTAGLLQMAIAYPFDFEGVVKGHYFHFASVPLYALFGLVVAWLLERRWLVPLGVLGVLLIIPPGVYTWLCVMR